MTLWFRRSLQFLIARRQSKAARPLSYHVRRRLRWKERTFVYCFLGEIPDESKFNENRRKDDRIY